METTSVVIVTHQSAAFIEGVLRALTADPDRPNEVIVVDSASTDATRSIISTFDVTAIESDTNIGFARACHLGADVATGSVLVFLGHDTVPEPGWLLPLSEAAMRSEVGAAMSTIVDAERPDTFNTSGGHLTYVGLAWISSLGDPIPAGESDLIDVAFPSGGAMAIRREIWSRFEGFRRRLFMYHEDSDLGWRLRLGGLRVVRVPQSRVRHTYDFSRTPEKMYYLERNRWIVVCTNYRSSTLAILAPVLALTDLGIWIVAVRDGWARQKFRAVRDAFRSRDSWKADRELVERNRRIDDAEMILSMDRRVSSARQVKAPPGSRVVDAALEAYLRVAVPLIRLVGRVT